MSDEVDASPSDTMDNRIGITRLRYAVLFQVHRVALAAGMAVGIFVSFVAVVTHFDSLFLGQLTSGDMIDSIFTTMISVVLTGTTLVVSIGQLVLTQETGPLGDQRERMSNAMDFRGFTAELTGQPSPTNPGQFLAALIDAVVVRSNQLREELDTAHSTELHDEVDVFVGDVIENAQTVSSRLKRTEFSTFGVLSAALDFNYGWKIARIERFQSEYAEELSDEDVERLDDIKTALSMFGPAREHVKTLYFQWELIDLSKMILYAALPAILVASLMIAVVEPATFPGTLFGVEHITLVVAGALTVTLIPFLLFVSYLLRILTVAKRTLAIEPLILRK
ncbi:hypothetical protein [Halovenus aranensis]|nr:hypothetical protein [Halovenus aranensis]